MYTLGIVRSGIWRCSDGYPYYLECSATVYTVDASWRLSTCGCGSLEQQQRCTDVRMRKMAIAGMQVAAVCFDGRRGHAQRGAGVHNSDRLQHSALVAYVLFAQDFEGKGNV